MKLPDELTVVQAAKVTGLQRYTLRDAIHRGDLAARQQKVPGGFKYLIPLEALREFARRRGVQSSLLGLEGAQPALVGESAVTAAATTTATAPAVAVVSASLMVKPEGALTGEGANPDTDRASQKAGSSRLTPLEAMALEADWKEFKESTQELIQLLRTLPREGQRADGRVEDRLEQMLQQIVEVQSDVFGLKKGFHQHLSKVEGRVVNLQQSVNGELRTSMERIRQGMNAGLDEFRSGLDAWQHNVDTVFDDMRSTLQEVAASQSDAEMRQAFVHKLSVDNQSTMGEVKKLMVDVSETVGQMISAQQSGAQTLERRLDDVKSSVDGVRRSVDRSTEMIIKWRQKMQMEQSKRGVKGWWNRLWGRSHTPVLSK
ncbi:helix-turn-helix domain-containing protein [Heliobacterium gestii]|uniref:Helix-turn-helix domain-containing protein n=1 Tax=Heliomicrobium gestii TaxID=2699 RepID=A0A845L730_HELGE|nr:helix-turn-helix domain-containing protein [Heliomicrobium gestii]MBM7866177.1 excisionase family DNA binding protein [Heliomicrobium gestii]MZP42497.1 helix-turn-helix domain-containing protein [Heliomicrobium gestii]